MPVSQETRERIRRNVGYPSRPRLIHPPVGVAKVDLFFPTRLPLPPGAIAPPPGEPPAVFPGHSYALTAQTVTVTREIKATPRIGYAFQLRQIVVMGAWAITDAVSLRILVSDDNDETAVVDPTGTDVVDFAGDLIGTADPGLFLAPSTGPLVLEPWVAVFQAGKYLKAKLHNATVSTVNWSVFFDLDELTA